MVWARGRSNIRASQPRLMIRVMTLSYWLWGIIVMWWMRIVTCGGRRLLRILIPGGMRCILRLRISKTTPILVLLCEQQMRLRWIRCILWVGAGGIVGGRW